MKTEEEEAREERLEKAKQEMKAEIQWSINYHKGRVEEFEDKLKVLLKLDENENN